MCALALFAAPAAAQDVVAPRCTVSVPAAESGAAADRRVGVLRAGDLVKLNVFRTKELSGDYLIDAQGRLVIPGLGWLEAAGRAPAQVEAGLRELLACRGLVPDLALQAQIRVSVLGEVRNPGLFPVDPGVTLLQLITLAGGEGPRADLARTRVIREGRTYPVNLQAALSGGQAGNIVLNSNDVVVVPRRTGVTREDVAFVLGAIGALGSVANLIVTLNR